MDRVALFNDKRGRLTTNELPITFPVAMWLAGKEDYGENNFNKNYMDCVNGWSPRA
jgi:hypothetical protein